MNKEKFWKILYLYVSKYNYDILKYRPEKNDVWLINNHNEIVRFIYSETLNNIEVDSNVYNIVKNEINLKKAFKLSSLKIKIINVSNINNFDLQDYKKYKVSENLVIERLILSDKNINNIVRTDDLKFINIVTNTDRYKKRVIDLYNSNDKNSIKNFKLNFLSILSILIFSFNYMLISYIGDNYNLYDYINYNYQKIISGQFYRLFTDFFVFDNIASLLLISIFIFICSFLVGEDLKIGETLLIIFVITFVVNLFVFFKYIDYINVTEVSFFGFLGSIFLLEVNKKNNNFNFIFTLVLPTLYLLINSIFSNVNFSMYVFSFVLGIFLKLLFIKNINYRLGFSLVLLMSCLGLIFNFLNIDVRSSINNHYYKKANNRLINNESNIDKLEEEINSNNKSIITYYELGMLKFEQSSVTDAKKIFLEAISFEDDFSPIYYQLALISRADFNEKDAEFYINKALENDPDETKYKDLKDELGV